jgi:VTC domain
MAIRLRRRAAPAGSTVEDSPAGAEPLQPGHRRTAVEDVRPADRGHLIRAPSRLHAFNRYEIKYLVDAATAAALESELAGRLDPDSHSGTAGYGVWSVYYDTPRLRFYWEKIEGLRFRRKLRLRHYGNQDGGDQDGDDRDGVDDATPVYVEIKQRVNRVTQKRRIRLPYRTARELCDDRVLIDHADADRPFVEEVLTLLGGLDLRPVTVTGYRRHAFVGRGAELGLRVTLDRRIRGRDRDFHLGAAAVNRFIVPPGTAILEVKADERVPHWLTDLTARRNMQVFRVSKYCQSVEAFGKAPRSVFHVREDGSTVPPAPSWG